MATWAEILRDVPDLASRVERRFGMGTNKTIATLRSDGSPRISAIEAEFGNGDVTFGMMGGSMKLLDVRRDPRVALHCPTIETSGADADDWPGDAKVAGRVIEVPAPDQTPHAGAGFFRLDITEISLAYVPKSADHMVIESWNDRKGLSRRTNK